MRYLAILVFLVIPAVVAAQGVLFIDTGTQVVVDKDAHIVVTDADWENHGNFDAGNGTVEMRQADLVGDREIRGSSTTLFFNLRVAMKADQLLLEQDVQVDSGVIFGNGYFNLNKHNVTLGAEGVLINERDASSFVGPDSGFVQKTVTLNAPTAVDPGKIGAVITSTSNLGPTTVKRGHVLQSQNGNLSIQRYFIVQPQTGTGLNATLRLRYLDTELNGVPEAELEMWQHDGSGWVSSSFSSRDATDNYVELAGLDSLGAFTLATSPTITAEMSDSIVGDNLYPGIPTDGDTLLIKTVIIEVAGFSAFDVDFAGVVDPNTTLVPGSVKSTPIAVPDTASVSVTSVVTRTAATGLLTNDFDSDPGLTVTEVAGNAIPGPAIATSLGSILVGSDGSYFYTAGAVPGSDSISYTLTDADGNTNSAVLVIEVKP